MIDDEKETRGAGPRVVRMMPPIPAALNRDADTALDRAGLAA